MGKRVDLTGKTFGKWKVLYYIGNRKWRCQCSCEKQTIRDVNTQTLQKGTSLSCGCYQDRSVKFDMKGEKYGEWTVIKNAGGSNWLCRCSCKNKTEKVIPRANLLKGKSKSCGCKRAELQMQTNIERYGLGKYPYREHWQIITLEDKELLADYIKESFDDKPSLSELAERLGVKRYLVSKKIHKYKLDTLVNINKSCSDKELELLDFVKNLGVEVIHGDRQVIAPYELDIYIPELKLAVEFNGNYWHSDAKINALYHQEKSLKCIYKGVSIIHVFEYEWFNDKNKVKRLLETVINGYKQTLNYIKVIDNNLDITLGCYNKENNNLISKMLFRNLGNSNWELRNTHIVDGEQQILEYFINNYNPLSITSYCDMTRLI